MIEIVGIAAINNDGFIDFQNKTYPAIDELEKKRILAAKKDKILFQSITKNQKGVPQNQLPALLMGSITYNLVGALPGRRLVLVNKENPPAVVLERLIKEGYKRIYVCGGRGIYKWFADNDLYTEFYLTKFDHSRTPMKETFQVNISDIVEKIIMQFTNLAILDMYTETVVFYTYSREAKLKILYHNVNSYWDLVDKLLYKTMLENRTAVKASCIYNYNLSYSLRNGIIPLDPFRRIWLKGVFHELMWFIQGRTDLEYLHQHKLDIWDLNVKNKFGESGDSIGKIYGYQWRNFGGSGFDQIKFIIDELRNNPTSRRMVLSSWCPPQIFDEACLPPCHVLYCFNVTESKELVCHLTQRSSDVGVGLPWNIASAALFVHLLARTCGLIPGHLDITLCNAHLYESHVEVLREVKLLNIDEFPQIAINPRENIEEYTFDDITLFNYNAPKSKKLELVG